MARKRRLMEGPGSQNWGRGWSLLTLPDGGQLATAITKASQLCSSGLTWRRAHLGHNVLVNLHHILPSLRERGREKLGKELLNEGENQHVPHRCKRDDEDDKKGHKGKEIFEGPLQCPHLARHQCVA